MSEHTPGPWIIFESEESFDILPAMRPGAIACVVGKHDANASLIASAPDFYAAATAGNPLRLPEFMDWLADRLVQVHGDKSNADFILSCRHRANLFRAAIAKATGAAS